MPSLATLRAFADTVEANDHVGAIRKFYAADASTRETTILRSPAATCSPSANARCWNGLPA